MVVSMHRPSTRVMDQDAYRIKRRRSPSLSSDSDSGAGSSSRSASPEPVNKYHRSTDSNNINGPLQYTCNLPPTCSQPETSTSFVTEEQLHRHQETFHRWVCRVPVKDRHQPPASQTAIPEGFVSKKKGWEWKECAKVFPDERLLSLHYTETHDPLAREKQARGDKIFECFVAPPACKKVFLTPGKRRRHLIDKHRFPEQYFFSITNHGINKIAQEDGLSISLIRPKKEPVPRLPEYRSSNGVADDTADTATASCPTPVVQETRPDVDMDSLTASLQQSSLQFVPKGVRKKQQSTTKP